MKYNFIDIGTSNFNYSIPELDQSGIYVEPLSIYLNDIPNYKNTVKENVAIYDRSCYKTIVYLDPNIIDQYGLPSWLKGCNKIDDGIVHPKIKNRCNVHGIDYKNLIRKQVVKCITLRKLFEKYRINQVDCLNIDTEGYDCNIVMQAIDLCNNGISISKIYFETNFLSDKEKIKETVDCLNDNNWQEVNTSDRNNKIFRKIEE